MLVSQIDFNYLQNLIGHKVHITADCDIVPNFNIVGYVKNVVVSTYENIIEVYDGKRIVHIGTNMNGLSIEIL